MIEQAFNDIYIFTYVMENGTPLPAEESTMVGRLHFYKILDAAFCDDQASVNEGIVCIPAVPISFMPDRVLRFLDPVIPLLRRFSVVRDDVLARNIVLLQFHDISGVAEFRKLYHGQLFDPASSEVCNVFRVKETTAIATTNLPAKLTALAPSCELPTCPRCLLHRLDEHVLQRFDDHEAAPVDGSTVNVASIDIEGSLLGGVPPWGASAQTCVACSLIDEMRPGAPVTPLHCTDCHTSHGVWTCLVCGYIGCSRSQIQQELQPGLQQGHSLRHYQSSYLQLHSFALEVDSQCVWDYTADKYVHRVTVATGPNKMAPPAFDFGKVIPFLKMNDMAMEVISGVKGNECPW